MITTTENSSPPPSTSSATTTSSSNNTNNNNRKKKIWGQLKKAFTPTPPHVLQYQRSVKEIMIHGNHDGIINFIHRYPNCCQEQFHFGGSVGTKYPFVMLCRRGKQLPLETIEAVYNAYPQAIYDASLHHALAKQAPLSVIQFLQEKHPEGAMTVVGGYLPIHKACVCNNTVAVLKFLLECYPDGIKKRVRGEYGLPLHLAVEHCASLEVIMFLVSMYPPALKMADYETREIKTVRGWLCYVGKNQYSMDLYRGDGGLPLHLACRDRPQSIVLIKYLILQYPDALKSKNRCHYLPLHFACTRGSHINIVKMIVDCCPVAVTERTIDYAWPIDLCTARLNPNFATIQYLLSKHPTDKAPNANLVYHYYDEATAVFTAWRIADFLRTAGRRAKEGYTFVYPRET